MSVNYTAPVPANYVAPAPTPDRKDESDDANNVSDSKSPDKNFTDIVYALLTKQAHSAQAGTSSKQSTADAAQTGTDATAATDSSGASLDPATTKKLSDLLNHLLAGLPADQKNAVMTALQSGNAKDVSAALIATGLTPEKLAAMIEDLKKKETGADDLLAGTVQIAPVPVQRDTIYTSTSLAIQQAAKGGPAQKGDADGLEDVDSQVNPLMTDSNGDTVGAAPAHGPGLDNVMKIFEHAQQTATGTPGSTVPHIGGTSPASAAAAPDGTLSASLSTVTGSADVSGDLASSGAQTAQTYPDGFTWSQKNDSIAAASQAAGLTIGGTAVMTSLVTNAAQAITPHPATQVIATTIIKGAADGQSKDITLRLDPPDLGKVEVKMTIDKDSGVKAHIVVEKPETYLMLQRDSHVLQRALSDAGLDVGGNALSFQMAQDGSQSGQSGNGGNSNQGNGRSAGAGGSSGNENVLETTMDWHVNTDTGHYNIWA